jgi:hypothetical protein
MTMEHVASKAVLSLENMRGENLRLEYRIRPSLSAQAWASEVVLAAAAGIREKNRFYNFPGHDLARLETLVGELGLVIERLKQLMPNLQIPILRRASLQASINELHREFAHSHRIAKSITPANQAIWDRFNVLLHQIESVLNEQTAPKQPLPRARIVVTFNQPCAVPIQENSYEDFRLSEQFGTAYVNYAHVGRHFAEVFYADDDGIPDEHIQPQRNLSADTSFWFGPTHRDDYEARHREEICRWFNARRERFAKLGHLWGDPKLALGLIPVADLLNPPTSMEEAVELIRNIANYPSVRDFTIVEN